MDQKAAGSVDEPTFQQKVWMVCGITALFVVLIWSGPTTSPSVGKLHYMSAGCGAFGLAGGQASVGTLLTADSLRGRSILFLRAWGWWLCCIRH